MEEEPTKINPYNFNNKLPAIEFIVNTKQMVYIN